MTELNRVICKDDEKLFYEDSYSKQFITERLERDKNYTWKNLRACREGEFDKLNLGQFYNDLISFYEDERLAFIRLNGIHTRLGFNNSIDAYNYLMNDPLASRDKRLLFIENFRFYEELNTDIRRDDFFDESNSSLGNL